MGWNNDLFPLLIVVSGPPFTGLFVYSPAPGHGNLVASITAQSGTDPYGNPYAAGITSYDTVFGGVTQINGALIEMFAGLNLVQKINPSGYVIYTPTAAAGNAVASIAPAGFTDANGNAIQQGITSYQGGGVETTFAQLFNANLFFNVAGLTQKAGISGGQNLNLSSGATAAFPVAAALTLIPAGSGAGAVQVQAALQMILEAFPAGLANTVTVLGHTSGHLEVVADPVNGDGNNYDTERLTLRLASNFTINSTTPQNIFPGKTLQAGLAYEVEVWAVTSNTTAADAASFAFAFTGTAAGLVDYETISGTAATTVQYTASATITQAFSSQAVAGNQQLKVNLTIAVTASGTLTFTGKELVAANTVTVFGGSRMRICPVVAS